MQLICTRGKKISRTVEEPFLCKGNNGTLGKTCTSEFSVNICIKSVFIEVAYRLKIHCLIHDVGCRLHAIHH